MSPEDGRDDAARDLEAVSLPRGSGHPDQFEGEEISDLVRLVTACDIHGALIERRSYKPPMPYTDASAIPRA
ncbi:hypothetical protein SQ03_24500 [Methylobacterium platani JCM 14648]|uniref:Uncharacterized protein n=3 Tax=Methylobacterium platani TaxID=427683 RepID=A0A179SJQ4_9HYPH|nr:hypothetical protein SQ03_24500 [Methylobacterium platani JCM 14648]OAS27250.1 hypothetical protein A5481_02165 [Methylobacterium platani]